MTRAADHISLATVARMSDEDARDILHGLRWQGTAGYPVCPRCGNVNVYKLRTRKTWKCRPCDREFSLTSGTLFQASKIDAKDILLAACLFMGGSKGVSSMQMARYTGRQQKTMWVLCHKFREALQRPDMKLSGVVQIDGCTIGGYKLRFNNVVGSAQKRYYQKKFDNRRVVTVMRESFMPGQTERTVAFVGKKESDSIDEIARRVSPDAIIQADGSRAWDGLVTLYDMMRNDHSMAFSANAIHTNMAESFFSLLRKMQSGVHHKIGAANLQAYANELAWRQDNRQLREDERVRLLLTLCFSLPPSKEFTGKWQPKKRAARRAVAVGKDAA